MAREKDAEKSATAAKWAKQVARYERSGLSMRAFATREGLKPGSLSFWKWKLEQDRRRPVSPRLAPLKFVELTSETPATRTPAASFEVILQSGRSVRVASGFDAAELARLVGVLEEARA